MPKGLISVVSDRSACGGDRSRGEILTFNGCWRSRQAQPRRWLYATKPKFVRLNDSPADALREAEEVHMILDLEDFRPGDIFLEISPSKYFVSARHNSAHFAEEICLPEDVDIVTREEHFRNGILELVLVRKTGGGPVRTRKGDNG